MFGYQPTFTAKNVKSISIRQNTVFKRKTITVLTSDNKIIRYYMYYQLINTIPQKLYACFCKVTSSSS